jgi:uncharacterized damage-inducible protein DinB
MYDPQGLLELHRRTHLGTAALLAHCASFSADELARELPGFGYPSLLEQWRHVIGAEDYWLNVLLGDWDIPDYAAACETVGELEVRRAVVAQQTAEYLAGQTAAALSTPREFATWPEARRRELAPAFVIMRTLTHAFQHRGQIAAMCRLLERPCPSSDFPVDA